MKYDPHIIWAVHSRILRRMMQSWLFLIILLMLSSQCSFAENNQNFRAGAYAVDITPTNIPVIINGGFLSRTADKISDPLHARCLVLDDGENRVGLCVIDTCLIPRELADQAKSLIHQATGLKPERILISATHTHYAPSLMQALGTPPDPFYPAFLLPRIVEGFRCAVSQLAPARIGWGVAPAPDNTHTRVWIRRPDRIDLDPFGQRTVRANMHPGYRNPDTIGPSGPSDPDLTVVSIQTRDGKPLALLANYAMHYHGGTQPVSADYYGLFTKKIKQLLGAEKTTPAFVGIMSQGFAGDQHWMDYSKPEKSVSMDSYAGDLAKLAAEICQRIQYQDWISITMRDKDLPLPVRMPDAKRLAWARGIVDSMQGRIPQNQTEVYAREQLWLESHPVVNTKLQVLGLGELGIAAFSGEVFAISSLKLKAQSPLRILMNFELANGEDGYIPPPELHHLGGYNTWACRSACLEADAEPKIVDALLGMLEDVSRRPRQKPIDPPGIYTLMQLRAEPLAYWRMNEFSGPQALDATRNQHTANYEKGVVFYLDGPISTFSGPGAVNRAPHFAGGRMIAPVARPDKQFSVELWFWNGLPGHVRGVTGCLFAWGDRVAIDGTNGAPGKLIFSNGASGSTLTGSTIVPIKNWTHVALTRDESKVVVYLNGLPDIVGDIPLLDPAKTDTLYVGGPENLMDTFEGKIDEVAVYDRPLGAAEVLRHFQQAGIDASGTSIPKVDPDPTGAYSAAVLETKPFAYWRMGENGYLDRQAIDSASHGMVAVYEEAVELYQLGPASPSFISSRGTNHAARFTGGRLHANVSKLNQSYSVSLWFYNERPIDHSPVTGYLFSRGPDGAEGAPGDHLGIGGTYQHQEGRLIFYNGNALGQVLTGKTLLQTGAWNHVVLVRNGRKVEVYLNGNAKPEISGEVEISPGATSGEIFFGGRNDNFANFQGRIDEVVIYNCVLSPNEIIGLADSAH